MDSSSLSPSKDVSSLQGPSSLDSSILLQRAKNWTARHLDVAKVKVIDNVSAEEMLGAEYVPSDGVPEFERVAGLFCEPSRESLEHGSFDYYEGEDNQYFYAIFSWLYNMVEADVTESAYMFKNFLNLIMIQIMSMANPKRKLLVRDSFRVTFGGLTPTHDKTV